jgi:hypothetical protein
VIPSKGQLELTSGKQWAENLLLRLRKRGSGLSSNLTAMVEVAATKVYPSPSMSQAKEKDHRMAEEVKKSKFNQPRVNGDLAKEKSQNSQQINKKIIYSDQ